MKREIIHTSDGSTTIHLPDWDESYHSKHGAIQEAYHVFIKNGLSLMGENPVSIMEIGFGTGLNAFITFLESEEKKIEIEYTGIEAYPVNLEEVRLMNYVSELKADRYSAVFNRMHQEQWNTTIHLSEIFSFSKRQQFFHEIEDVEKFDLIYFDAFGFRIQPELWSTEIFTRMFKALKKGGMLTTYAARSPIKKSMIAAGFAVEKHPGPPGKREMFRAIK